MDVYAPRSGDDWIDWIDWAETNPHARIDARRMFAFSFDAA